MSSTQRTHHIDSVLCALALGASLSGCMTSPTNGRSGPASYNGTIAFAGFTSNPQEKVSVKAQNWCTGNTDLAFSTSSVTTPSTLKDGIQPGTDLTGYAWSASRSITGASCQYWTPYGCNDPDWGPKQGVLRVTPEITAKDGTVTTGKVFNDPLENETSLNDCITRKSRENPSASVATLALDCADPDNFADVRVAHPTSTWSVHLTEMHIRTSEEGNDEPYNPVVIGVRAPVTPSATINMAWQGSLSAKSLSDGDVYTLSTKQGRVAFRNVQTISMADWLGCDPATARLKAADIEAKNLAGIHCTLNQTPKDIELVGAVILGIEHDGTSNSTAVSIINDAIASLKTGKIQDQVRSMGVELNAIRDEYRAAFKLCNDTADAFGQYGLECGLKLAAIEVNPNLQLDTNISFDLGFWQSLGVWFSSGFDPDDKIGRKQVIWVNIDSDFFQMLTVDASGRRLPQDVNILKTTLWNTLSNEISLSGDDAVYGVHGAFLNFTDKLRARVASDRTANGGACPFKQSPEAAGTTVNM